jgi:Tryptophan-associated transmembrane protein (Trp_oprn_chp)
VAGYSAAPDRVRDAYHELGVDHPGVTLAGWYWVAAVATVLTLLTTLAAVRLVPSWPEMGRKYDAPADAAPRPTPQTPEEQENLDLWRAMDEGRDPTA